MGKNPTIFCYRERKVASSANLGPVTTKLPKRPSFIFVKQNQVCRQQTHLEQSVFSAQWKPNAGHKWRAETFPENLKGTSAGFNRVSEKPHEIARPS